MYGLIYRFGQFDIFIYGFLAVVSLCASVAYRLAGSCFGSSSLDALLAKNRPRAMRLVQEPTVNPIYNVQFIYNGVLFTI